MKTWYISRHQEGCTVYRAKKRALFGIEKVTEVGYNISRNNEPGYPYVPLAKVRDLDQCAPIQVRRPTQQ
jgi:hypothetical protein